MTNIADFMKRTSIINFVKIVFGFVILVYVIFSVLIPSVNNFFINKDKGNLLLNLVTFIPLSLVSYALLRSGFKKQSIPTDLPVSQNIPTNPETRGSSVSKINNSTLVYSIVCCIPTILMFFSPEFKNLELGLIIPFLFLGIVVFIQLPLTIAFVLLKDSKHVVWLNGAVKLIGGLLLISSGLVYWMFFW